MSKRVIIAVIAVAALVIAGVSFDRHRASVRNQATAEKRAAEEAKNKVPPLPQHGVLLARRRQLVQHRPANRAGARDRVPPSEREAG